MRIDVRRKTRDARWRGNARNLGSLRLSSSVSRLRSGLTLLEVILSLAIFVMSIAVISKLVELGVRASRYAQLQGRAVMLAESKMGELVAGILPLDSATGDTFSEDSAWQWQATISDGPVDGLKWVNITVTPTNTGELTNNRERIEFTLSRWLLDPSYSADLDLAASSATSTSGTSGSASSSGGTTGAGN